MPTAAALQEAIYGWLSDPSNRSAFLQAVQDDPRPEGELRRLWFPLFLSNEEGIARVAKGSADFVFHWIHQHERDLSDPSEAVKLWWDLQHGKTSPFPE